MSAITKTPASGDEKLLIYSDPVSGQPRLISTQDIADLSVTEFISENTASGILSGGAEWVSGLSYDVTIIEFALHGVTYTTAETTVTLATADPSDPRIDVIVANINGTTSVVQGTPAGSPSKPAIDPLTQIEVTFALVAAGATTPTGTSSDSIYSENAGSPTEWDVTESTGGVRVTINSSADFYSGALSIAASALQSGDIITFTDDAPLSIGTIDSISFRIKATSFWDKGRIIISAYNGITKVSSDIILKHDGTTFDTNTTDWYHILIPTSLFEFTDTEITKLLFTRGGRISDNISFYLDLVKYNIGTITPEPVVVGITDHTLLTNIGTNTHAQIDTHLALVDEHIDWTANGAGTIDPSNYVDTNTPLATNDQTLSGNRNIILGNNSLTITKTTTSTSGFVINHNDSSIGAAQPAIDVNVLNKGVGISVSTVSSANAGIDCVTGGLGVSIQAKTTGGTTYATQAINAECENSVNNDIRANLVLVSKTTGTAVPGLGAGTYYMIENGSGNTGERGLVGVELSNVTDTSEIAKFNVDLDYNGALTSIFSLLGEGVAHLKATTAAKASSVTPIDGMITYVSDTNGTFTSAGLWSYISGAWVKLIPDGSIYTANGTLSTDRTITVNDGSKLILSQNLAGAAATDNVLFITANNSGGSFPPLYVFNSSGVAASFTGSSSSSIVSISQSSTGNGLSVTTTSATPIVSTINSSGTNDTSDIARFTRNTTGTAANGIGIREVIQIENDAAATSAVAHIITKLTNANSADMIAEKIFRLIGIDNNIYDRFSLSGDGWLRIYSITAAQASTLTPQEGMIVMVSDTNGTFTKIGLWAYQNTSWKFLAQDDLTGDVTSSGLATTIANDAVTYAKIQNVVADQVILGNISGAGGIVDELTTAEVISMLGLDSALTPSIQIEVFDGSQAVTTGDGIKSISIPSSMSGGNLIAVLATVEDKGITGTTNVQIRRWRGGVAADMLSTLVTIGDEWFAEDGVIDLANDDIQTGDRIYIDVDAIHSGTAPNGLSIVLTFDSP